MPKQQVLPLLPREGRRYAVRFYYHAKCFYPNEKSVADALEMVKHAISFFESMKEWYANKTATFT
jgi:hypothetical protein